MAAAMVAEAAFSPPTNSVDLPMESAASAGPPMGSTASRFTSIVSKNEAERIERMALSITGQARDIAPAWAIKLINEKGGPVLDAIRKYCEEYGPRFMELVRKACDIYRRLPKTEARLLWGLVLCFLGGRYAVSLAAFEAFRFTGGSAAWMHIQDLSAQLAAVKDANAIDDSVDIDEDGIADVKQVDGKKLLARKLDLALRTLDPEIVVRAMGGLWTAYMGVLTVLKMKFAQTVALAQSLGDTLRPTMAKVAGPTILAVTPPEYRKWISPGIDFACKAIAAILAWRIQRLISTVQSGFKGGMIVSTALLEILRQRAIVAVKDDDTCFDEIMGWSLGAMGIYVQVFKGGPVPTILSPLLWPLDFVEWILKWHVTWTPVPGKVENSSP